MGDVGNYWNDMRAHKRELRTKRRNDGERLAEELLKLGAVRLNDHGPHMRFIGAVDIWPSTGTIRNLPGASRRDVENARRLISQARANLKGSKTNG